jgi:hypothetical protein
MSTFSISAVAGAILPMALYGDIPIGRDLEYGDEKMQGIA